ncbi:hypothetical protein RJ639_037058 [Escallonia herrerae]|uniref:Solute carrier family 40 member n=1 Tax=Escallonia herrerae TaxID=1293975 RepID=A0AA89BIE6_9ASTE|nr:hypothetical protein RJ639_037058 [Escallonia herrerae]
MFICVSVILTQSCFNFRVVVISEGHPPEALTTINSIIRRIDLICKLFAPVASGFIISFVSLTASAQTIALWNVISVCLQYWLLISVYNGIPALSERSQKRVTRPVTTDLEEDPSTSDDRQNSSSYDETDSDLAGKTRERTLIEKIANVSYVNACRVYMSQDVVLPGLALALLSSGALLNRIVSHDQGCVQNQLNNTTIKRLKSVENFGILMTAALEWKGIPAYVIGIARGVSATIGIAATFLYPILLVQQFEQEYGFNALFTQWICLLVCVASIWVQNSLISAYLLMGGVAASRLGLWMFDLAVIQQMQDQVHESDRCVVGGVQNSFQSVLDLMTYVMGLIISNPQVDFILHA